MVIFFHAVAILLWAGLAWAQKPGEALPPWTPGTLDLHQIHTGRGNALLMKLPNGQTVLVDAGEVPDGPALELGPRRPNASRSAGEWIAEYVKRHTPRLDYLVLTHYHDDHFGGIEAVAKALPIGKLLDRGDDPAPPPYPSVKPFLRWRAEYRSPRETVVPGRRQQFGGTYPDFEIRNVAANGVVWTGQNDEARSVFPANWRQLPADQQPGENHFSIALRLRYGRFDYFTGADLIGTVLDELPAWHDIESPVAKVVGPVDVAVLNHHGWVDTTNSFFLKTLAPQVAILPAWHASHPDHAVLRRLRSPRGPKPDLFTTTLLDAPKAVFRYLGNAFRNTEGHIVVRVAPGGGSFQVIVLDATQEEAPILQVAGPYKCR